MEISAAGRHLSCLGKRCSDDSARSSQWAALLLTGAGLNRSLKEPGPAYVRNALIWPRYGMTAIAAAILVYGLASAFGKTALTELI